MDSGASACIVFLYQNMTESDTFTAAPQSTLHYLSCSHHCHCAYHRCEGNAVVVNISRRSHSCIGDRKPTWQRSLSFAQHTNSKLVEASKLARQRFFPLNRRRCFYFQMPKSCEEGNTLIARAENGWAEDREADRFRAVSTTIRISLPAINRISGACVDLSQSTDIMCLVKRSVDDDDEW